MKKLFQILFILTASPLTAQQLQVLSAKDSLRIPFASLLIKSNEANYSSTANDQGLVALKRTFDDTTHYTLMVQCFGFENYTRRYTGAQIAQLGKIYLKPAHINLDEVVITAQYAPVVADQSVQRMKVIDKEKIQQMGAVNLRDVLTNQLNVRLQQDNVLGAGMSMQGISGENVKILVDGVPLIGRQNGNIDLSQVNLNNVERIEMVEGPLSVQYGTNALAGTINLITKKTNAKRYSVGVTSYYESIGTYNLNADAGFAFKKHELQISGGRNYFDGWNPGDAAFQLPKSHIADSSRYQQWKPKEQYFASAYYRYTLKKVELGLKSAWFNEVIVNRGYPRAPYGESTFDDRYTTDRSESSLSVNSPLGGNWSVKSLSAYNYYNRIKRTVYKDLTTLEEQLSPNASDQDTSKFTLLMSRASFVCNRPAAAVSYELGYDLNYESALGKRIEKELQYMGDYAGFATAEYKPFTGFIFKPGLRYAHNTVYNTPLIPSAVIKYNPSANHTFRASYARGFRAPALKELYFDFVDVNHNIIGNTGLKAEQGHNFSAAYNYSRDIRKCLVRFDATLFYNHIFNLITLAQINGTQYSYINVGNYKTGGVQLGGSLNFKRLFVQTGFNYTGRYNQLSESSKVPTFAYSPEVLANATYKLLKSKTSIALFYKYSGRLPGYALVNNVVTSTFIAGYSMFDATISRLMWRDRISLSVGCKNILNITNISSSGSGDGVHNTSTTSVPLSTGRNYFIKLAFNFSKA